MKKQKVNVNYPFTHRRKYYLLLGGKLYFISYIYIYIYIYIYCSFFQKFCLYPASVKTYLVKNFLKRLVWAT